MTTNRRCAATAALFVIVLSTASGARDGGRWDDSSTALTAEHRAWVTRQKQRQSAISCCGDADMYFADRIEVESRPDGDHVFAIITDERDDAPLGRPHREVGDRFEIPPGRFNDAHSDPNLTGHGILFIGRDAATREEVVLCYFDHSGT